MIEMAIQNIFAPATIQVHINPHISSIEQFDEFRKRAFVPPATEGFGQMIVCNNRSTGLCVLIGLFLLSPQAALLALLGASVISWAAMNLSKHSLSATASWSAPALWSFSQARGTLESAGGPAHSRTLSRI